MLSLSTKLRQIIAEHGLKETHQSFQDILKADYQFLQTLFSIASQSATQPPHTTQQEQEPKEKEKKPVKKANNKPAAPDTIDSIAPPTKFQSGMRILVTKNLDKTEEEYEDDIEEQLVQTAIEELPPAVMPSFSNPKEAKVWQREQEEKRLAHNKVKGIDPETLLTPDNLRMWVEQDKKGYSVIARDILGLPEYRIAEFAKQHNILSETSKRRAAIIRRKASGK